MDEREHDPGFVPGAGSEAASLRAKVQASLLQGPGVSSIQRRQAAYRGAEANPQVRALLETVARTPWKVTDELVAAARQAGLSEDEVFELVVVATFGQTNRQLAAAHRALDAAFADPSFADPSSADPSSADPSPAHREEAS